MRRSLERRKERLEELLKLGKWLAERGTVDEEELEDDPEAERLKREEELVERLTAAETREELQAEINTLAELTRLAREAEQHELETKLTELRKVMEDEQLQQTREKLLIFTESRETLEYLTEKLRGWGYSVVTLHGGMNLDARIRAEHEFRERAQVMVSTEAGGEGINLQFCSLMVNYDIPWNPNRLEQRMGRIHRYGQRKDCLIFNFVAANTIEGRVLEQLLEKLQKIRDALDDDAVFNVVGEVLTPAHIERVLRDYYAGRLGDADLEERLLRDVDEEHFRAICRNALEGLASKTLNLQMLIERRARAQERRVVPETIARFLREAAEFVPWTLKPVAGLPHTFDPARTPLALRQYEKATDWKLPALADRYPRFSTDRETAEKHNLEWVTPGHPLFEAVRRHAFNRAAGEFKKGAVFYSLRHEQPARIDFYRARLVNGLGKVVHERLFAVELSLHDAPRLRELSLLGDLIPAAAPDALPPVVQLPEATAWLHSQVLTPFRKQVHDEQQAEIERIANHVEISLTELIQRADEEIGRAQEAIQRGEQGAEGRLAMAEERHAQLLTRRERRRAELQRQRALTLQDVERIASALVLPHPEREAPEVRRLQPDRQTEAIAMRVVIEHERAQGRQVFDVSDKNLGYDITSVDLSSGELRLIEVKGIGGATGAILLTPNERRVAEDRRDCYWLYVVTHCDSAPTLQEPIRDPARLPWHEVTQVAHYYLSVDALTKPMQLRETPPSYT